MPILFAAASMLHAEVVRVEFNGLELGIDEQSGAVVYMAAGPTGAILESPPESAGLVDMAYPLDSFAALRLASRFSRARVSKAPDALTITWEPLGASRGNIPLPGAVFAQVVMRPAGDRHSVILRCRVENRSKAPVPQILFPDLHGLRPIYGLDRTELRLAGAVVHPFAKPLRDPDSAGFYVGRGWHEYSPTAYGSGANALRWLDYGSLRGGLSVFQRKWATGDPPGLYTQRTEVDPMSLRIAWEHRQAVQPGQSWDSGEFWFTPHAGGWAKGIEVFRQYVNEVNPPRALPRHVRDGLGFRTYWELQVAEPDAAHAAFRYTDIPRIAQDALEHGIDEIMPWGWAVPSSIPINLHPELGTLEEFLEGLRRAKAMGVNVTPFVSLVTVRNRYAARYGVKPGTSDWTYHPELIPNFRPYYSKFWDGAHVPTDNELWQRDVSGALTAWIDRGLYSFGWDEFIPEIHGAQTPRLITLIEKIRALARARDPDSTFCAEVVHASDLEYDGAVLDYTWNWADYVDAAPLINVLRAPRLNCNVEDSPRVVKKAFCDNLYLNVMPKKPDQPNGTALISDHPALSTALKQVARLRRQFLPYFTEGVFLGSSMLSQPAAGFIRGYQLRNRLLLAVLNDGEIPQRIAVLSDLGLWLPSAGHYRVRYVDSTGKALDSHEATATRWSAVTRLLQPLELAFFEISAE